MNRIKHLLKDLAILIRANLWLIPSSPPWSPRCSISSPHRRR